jgi:predicted DNA-binding transcriptional regulator AlpA
MAAIPSSPASRRLLNLANTAKLVDSSPATTRRWSQNPATRFPEPVNIHNKLFWFQDGVLAWIESQPRVSKKPTTLQSNQKRIEPSNTREVR